MTQFATEFPVSALPSRATFVAQVIAWLRGTNYSKILDKHQDADLEGEMAYLRASNGEELRIREYSGNNWLAFGFRYDFPDDDGRLWRSEAVLRSEKKGNKNGIMRFRTQCIARRTGARLDIPRKPYLIKALLTDGWGGNDGVLTVTDQPTWLVDDYASLDLAEAISRGQASLHLPVIYVSATGESEWVLTTREIEKLAYNLGGIAHVVAEPTRQFSFQLRDRTDGENVYGGSLGIALPGHGIMRRLYLGWRLLNNADLINSVQSTTAALQSQMPYVGWDWTELQEQALRKQRERERSRLTEKEVEQLYLEEIENLRERVQELDRQIKSRPLPEAPDDDAVIARFLSARIGPEIYPGEFLDRLRSAAALAYTAADQNGLDRRSRMVFDSITRKLQPSAALHELLEDLKRATKDPKRVATELASLLGRHGYNEKSDNKHVKLEGREGYAGLNSIVVPKTPSDHRGLTNLRKQVENALGIGKLLK